MTLTEFKKLDFSCEVRKDGDFDFCYTIKDDREIRFKVSFENFIKYCSKTVDGFEKEIAKQIEADETLNSYLRFSSNDLVNDYHLFLFLREYVGNKLIKKDGVTINQLEESFFA